MALYEVEFRIKDYDCGSVKDSELVSLGEPIETTDVHEALDIANYEIESRMMDDGFELLDYSGKHNMTFISSDGFENIVEIFNIRIYKLNADDEKE